MLKNRNVQKKKSQIICRRTKWDWKFLYLSKKNPLVFKIETFLGEPFLLDKIMSHKLEIASLNFELPKRNSQIWNRYPLKIILWSLLTSPLMRFDWYKGSNNWKNSENCLENIRDYHLEFRKAESRVSIWHKWETQIVWIIFYPSGALEVTIGLQRVFLEFGEVFSLRSFK